MRFKQIIENTTAGAVATVAQPLMTQARESVNVKGLKPVQQLIKGKSAKKGPYANSIAEGKVKELTINMKELSDIDFKKKYGKTKAEMKASMKKEVNEDDLSEQDLIVLPGGKRLKTGFIPHDPDRAEHEGETLKNSLRTIIRVASDLDKELSTRDNFPEWVSEKIGATKSMMVSVMDYLISAKEMQRSTPAMDEGQQFPDNSTSLAKRSVSQAEKSNAPKTPSGHPTVANRFHGKAAQTRVEPTITQTKVKRKDSDRPIPAFLKKEVEEGAKVDRMVKHVKQSEKKLGHSAKEAENIAWATANKRGMLDNKNKKK